jgi:hypothetical protein
VLYFFHPICGCQFVENPEQKLISAEKREQIRKLLLERIPLRGICRVMEVRLRWLLGFMASEYEQLPDCPDKQAILKTEKLLIWSIDSELDEMWSFGGSKENQQWIWIAMDAKSRQNNKGVFSFFIPLFSYVDTNGVGAKPTPTFKILYIFLPPTPFLSEMSFCGASFGLRSRVACPARHISESLISASSLPNSS